MQALKGAELLVNSSASSAGAEQFWEHASFMRATENASWYVVCSVVGEQRGDIIFGGSRIVGATGQVVAAGKFNEEDVIIADIDLSLSRKARASSHLFNARQPELYAEVTQPTP